MNIRIFFVSTCLAVALGCATPLPEQSIGVELRRDPASGSPNPLHWTHVRDLGASKGQSFFSLNFEISKALDEVATAGFAVASKNDFTRVYSLLDDREKNALSSRNRTVSDLDLKADPFRSAPVDMRTLFEKLHYDTWTAMMIALASGGGVSIRLDDENFIYLTGFVPRAVGSGRVFMMSHNHTLSDPSDMRYLRELQKYLSELRAESPAFYSALLGIVIDNDTSGFSQLSSSGRTVATDFFGIYSADQIRHMIFGLRRLPHSGDSMKDVVAMQSDDALLEVTLLSRYQMSLPPGSKEISLSDWWRLDQISKLSGLALTREEQLKLGTRISKFERDNHAELVDAVESFFKENNRGGNVYEELSKHLIHENPPHSFGNQAPGMLRALTRFLDQVSADASSGAL